MAAVVHSLHERQALDWAVEYFRGNADELTVDFSKHFFEELFPGVLLDVQDVYDYPPEERKMVYSAPVDAAFDGHPDAIKSLRLFAAQLIKRGDPLPEPINDFIAAFLCGNVKPNRRKSGPHPWHRRGRDRLIWEAIEHIAKTWKFPPTRNPSRKKMRSSGASIVREALATVANLNLGEAAINTIWNKANAKARAQEADLKKRRLKRLTKLTKIHRFRGLPPQKLSAN